MRNFAKKSRSGVANAIFGATVIVLIAVAAVGYGLYATTPGHTTTTTASSSTEDMMTSTSTSEVMSSSAAPGAFQFSPKSGAMISNAWLLVVPLGMDGYAVSIHAEGLEPNATYFVEGALSGGSMLVVPVSNESTSMMDSPSASEFQSNANGTGVFWIELSSNPSTVFENLELAFLPNMSMQNATVIASTSFTAMSTTTISGESMTTS